MLIDLKARDRWRHLKAITKTAEELNEIATLLNSDSYEPNPGVKPTLENADQILEYLVQKSQDNYDRMASMVTEDAINDLRR